MVPKLSKLERFLKESSTKLKPVDALVSTIHSSNMSVRYPVGGGPKHCSQWEKGCEHESPVWAQWAGQQAEQQFDIKHLQH